MLSTKNGNKFVIVIVMILVGLTSVFAAPTISIASPTNTTYTTNTILFNITTNEASSSCWYSFNSGIANLTMTSINSWVSNTSLVSGLEYMGQSSTTTITYNLIGDNKWTLIIGENDGVFNGYYWNGTGWSANTSLIAGLGDVGANSATTIAYNITGEGLWVLIAGESDGVFNGFFWNGTGWTENTSLVSGLGDVGAASTPFVTYNLIGDNKWTLFSGENDGVFNGYYWNGTGWTENTSLVSGLVDIGFRSTPFVTYNLIGDNKWTLFSGADAGMFRGFYWSGTGWTENTSLVTGLGDIGSRSTPCIVYNLIGDNKWTLFSGEFLGVFKGFYWNSATSWNATNTSMSQGSHNVSFYCNDTAGNVNTTGVNQYFFIDSTTPTISIVSPTNTTYTTTTILFNITTNEAGGSCWYTLNNGINNVTMTNTSVTSWNATNTSMSQGQHQVKYYCNDSAGNVNTTGINQYFAISTNSPPYLYNVAFNTTINDSTSPIEAGSWLDYISINLTDPDGNQIINATLMFYNADGSVISNNETMTLDSGNNISGIWIWGNNTLLDSIYTQTGQSYNFTIYTADNNSAWNSTTTYLNITDTVLPIISELKVPVCTNVNNTVAISFLFTENYPNTSYASITHLNGSIMNTTTRTDNDTLTGYFIWTTQLGTYNFTIYATDDGDNTNTTTGEFEVRESCGGTTSEDGIPVYIECNINTDCNDNNELINDMCVEGKCLYEVAPIAEEVSIEPETPKDNFQSFLSEPLFNIFGFEFNGLVIFIIVGLLLVITIMSSIKIKGDI